MTENTEHTKLPWVTCEEGLRMLIRDNEAMIVAVRHRAGRSYHEENFRLIVHSVNTLPSVVAALDEMINTFQPFTLRPVGAPNSCVRIQQDHQIEVHKRARAALAAARRRG